MGKRLFRQQVEHWDRFLSFSEEALRGQEGRRERARGGRRRGARRRRAERSERRLVRALGTSHRVAVRVLTG